MPEMSEYAPGTPSWVDLGTPDVDAATRFYGGLFGWEVQDQGPDAGGYRVCLLRGKAVAGMGPQQNPGPPWWTTYVTVADADATVATVKEAGGAVFMGPMDVLDVGRMAVFADTVGAVVAIWQPRAHLGAQLVNEPGTLCWNELATRDIDTAKAFYEKVFGWDGTTSPYDGSTYTEWHLGGRAIGGMIQMDDQWPAEIPSHWMVYFAVDDCDASAAKATELGGTVSVPPTDIPPGRFSVLNDPQGAVFSVISLSEPPA